MKLFIVNPENKHHIISGFTICEELSVLRDLRKLCFLKICETSCIVLNAKHSHNLSDSNESDNNISGLFAGFTIKRVWQKIGCLSATTLKTAVFRQQMQTEAMLLLHRRNEVPSCAVVSGNHRLKSVVIQRQHHAIKNTEIVGIKIK